MHRTETYTIEIRGFQDTETLTHVITYDEDDNIVGRESTTDEESSLPFRISPTQQDMLSAIENAWLSEHRRVQVVAQRRYGKSRVGRELQRNPSLLPMFLGEDARVLIITTDSIRQYLPDHIASQDDMTLEALRSYDAIILDECGDPDLISELPNTLLISFGYQPEPLHGFHRVVCV